MRTDQLIHALAADAPASRGGAAIGRRLLLGAALGLAGVAGVVVTLGGVRGDLLRSMGGAGLVKFGGGVALAAGALHLLRRMGRPGTAAIDGVCMGLFALAAAIVLASVAAAPVTAPIGAVIGATPHYAWTMVLLSAIPLATVLGALRSAAPTRPREAGAAAGLLAGAVAALGYALWCPADDVLFVAVSYGAAILVTCGIGALVGNWLLRW